jgi:hypothetical protein
MVIILSSSVKNLTVRFLTQGDLLNSLNQTNKNLPKTHQALLLQFEDICTERGDRRQ